MCRYGRPDSSKDEFTNASYGLGLFVGLFLTLMRFFGLGVVRLRCFIFDRPLVRSRALL